MLVNLIVRYESIYFGFIHSDYRGELAVLTLLRIKEPGFATAAGAFKAPVLVKRPTCFDREAMNDVVFIAVMILFFLVSGAYVRFCDKL